MHPAQLHPAWEATMAPAGESRPAAGRAASRARWAGTAAAAGFVAYAAWLLASIPVSPGGGGGLGLKGQMLGVLSLLVPAAPFAGHALARFRDGLRGSALLFFFFWIVALALAPFGRYPVPSTLYVLLTFGVYVAAGNVWLAPRRHLQALALAVAAICFGFCLHAVATWDLGAGRGIGLLQPNKVGAIALTPVLVSFFLPGYLRAPIYAVALALCGYVGARGSLASAGLFILVHEAAMIVVRRRAGAVAFCAVAAAVAVPCAAGVLLVFPQARASSLEAVEAVAALGDPERGVDSGFSGRVDGWRMGLREIREHLAAGIGFRAAKVESTHSAILDLVMETGAPGAMLFALFIVVRLAQLGRCVLATGLSDGARERAAGVLAGLSAILLLSVFEILLLNVGFLVGACAFLFYAYHEPLSGSASGNGAGALEAWGGASLRSRRGGAPCS
jgi:hypothetical protein